MIESATPAHNVRLTCRVDGPLGEMLLVATPDGGALCGLYLERQKYYPPPTVDWRMAPRLPLFARAASQLREYFTGERTAFDLPLAPDGTPFQREVWSAIRDVPFGTTISYAELARRCGRPSAVRAAGAATGRNPMTIVVPCHRIMGSGGALTGYAGGLDRKRFLLALEARGIDAARAGYEARRVA
jgi:methylated-DNA-[protein]-cysteine S-methyltransferase